MSRSSIQPLRLEQADFLFQFLPALLTIYFLVLGADAFWPRLSRWIPMAALSVLVAASAIFIFNGPFGPVLLAAAAMTWASAALIESMRARGHTPGAAKAILTFGIVLNVAVFAYTRWTSSGSTFAFAGVTVLGCHAIALLLDVFRGRASVGAPLMSALYLVQFPVLPGGPIVRFQEFGTHHLRLRQLVGLGAFTYGMRRLVIGLVKVLFVAATLAGPVDAIFALPPARLGTAAAWLGAVCVSLQLYFQFSGYADIAIGLGRMLGVRYPENFRRPYLADSVREFWRRWNVTFITWLRDYLSLPMAGRDRPTPRLFMNIVLAFAVIGLWHGATANVLIWAVYSGGWLALEAIGLGSIVERWPRPARHLYLLAVVIVGWVILRADSASGTLPLLAAMAGYGGRNAMPADRYLTLQVWSALAVAIIGAGPLVPWLSRWRVSLDATAAAMVMMITAVSLWLWRGALLVIGVLRPFGRPRSADRS